MARVRIERNISFDEERKRYYVNLDFGLNPDTGKQIKRTRTFKKLTEARSTLRRHEADRDRGNIVLPQELTVAQWLDRWMKEVVEFSCESTTVYSYRKIIEKHIVPALGSIPLQKLTPQHLQHYYAEKINGGLSSNTVRKHHDLLNTALKVAVRQEILLYSPSEKVEAPKIKRPDIHYYSMLGYYTSIRSNYQPTEWSSDDYDQYLKSPEMFNINYHTIFRSIVKGPCDNWLIEHNDAFCDKEIKTIHNIFSKYIDMDN